MSQMRIQAALDGGLTMEDAYRTIDATLGSVEVYEIGTPFLFEHMGLKAVRAVRANYPGITLYVDTKIDTREAMDANELCTHVPGSPYDVAAQAFEAGGDSQRSGNEVSGSRLSALVGASVRPQARRAGKAGQGA